MIDPKPEEDIVVRTSIPPWLKDVGKLGTASFIAIYLVFFVTQSMKGLLERDQLQRIETQKVMQNLVDTLQMHQYQSEAAMEKLLQTTLVICNNGATDAVQRRACFDDDLAQKLKDYFKKVR